MKEIRYAKVNGESIPVVISDETEALLAAKADGRAIIGLAGMDGNPAEFALERLEDADEEILERAARSHLLLQYFSLSDALHRLHHFFCLRALFSFRHCLRALRSLP